MSGPLRIDSSVINQRIKAKLDLNRTAIYKKPSVGHGMIILSPPPIGRRCRQRTWRREKAQTQASASGNVRREGEGGMGDAYGNVQDLRFASR